MFHLCPTAKQQMYANNFLGFLSDLTLNPYTTEPVPIYFYISHSKMYPKCNQDIPEHTLVIFILTSFFMLLEMRRLYEINGVKHCIHTSKNKLL